MALDPVWIAEDGEVTEPGGLQPSLIATDGEIDFYDEGTDWNPRHEHILRGLWVPKSLLGIPSNYREE